MAETPSCPTPAAAAVRPHLLRTAPDLLGRELRQPDRDLWAAILPNPSNPAVPYKVQYFAPFGLAGHQVHPTPAAALVAALAKGFTEPDPGALNRLAHSAAWQAAYAVPARARPGTASYPR
jgi:hypothetical protein